MSNKREPLGTSMTRTYNWPKAAQNGTVAFGIPTKDSMNAKEILYPTNGADPERPEFQQMYLKTHSNFSAGEQKRRGYNWNVNQINGKPDKFAFGFGEQRLLNGASRAVHSERYDMAYPKTVVVNKIVEDQKQTLNDQLGVSKNLGQGQPVRDSDFVYGIKNSCNDWNAAKCLQGEPTQQELNQDKDLGKSVKLNSTNIVRSS